MVTLAAGAEHGPGDGHGELGAHGREPGGGLYGVLKTIFEKVIDEIRNIEYALNYFIRISTQNKRVKPTLIFSNENSILAKQLLQKATADAFQDHPEL